MYKLFIDTHADLITLAFISENEIFKQEVLSEHGHAQILLPTFKEMLDKHNIKVDEIEEIIAVHGPGSFTGIRIGLSMVKILSYTKNIPVKLISSLESYLVSTDTTNDKISYIEDARGAYVLVFDKNNKVIIEEQYIEEYEDIIKKYERVPNILNIKKILDYSKNLKTINPHLIKANYIKKIEVEK